ncbi:MAG: cyanophycinase [Pleurocapsa sp. SU_196_0]|nr:cyanophycinase [Pleurocapsa sp. SU_196_0]
MRAKVLAFGLVGAMFLGVSSMTQGQGQGGSLVIAGGALQDSSGAIFKRLVQLAGKGSICALGTANGNPARVADLAVSDIKVAGGVGVAVDITTRNAAQSTIDPKTLEILRGCAGFWFEGGDQRRIMDAFAPNGKATPALEVIRQRFAAGAVIGGTSAGAAMMSDPMIAEGSSLEALRAGKATLESGLGFVQGVVTDQHFLKRGRFARLLLAMAQSNSGLAVGVDEDTALIIPASGAWQVIGSSSVTIFEAPRGLKPDKLEDIEVSMLSQGDTFDPATRAITVSSARKAIAVNDTYFGSGVRFDANLSAPDAFKNLMQDFADSPENTASGLFMTGSSATNFIDDAWRVILEKTEHSTGYHGRGDGNTYSVVRLKLRLEGVRVSVVPR